MELRGIERGDQILREVGAYERIDPERGHEQGRDVGGEGVTLLAHRLPDRRQRDALGCPPVAARRDGSLRTMTTPPPMSSKP